MASTVTPSTAVTSVVAPTFARSVRAVWRPDAMIPCDVPYRAPTLRPPEVAVESTPSWRVITSDIAAITAVVLIATASLAIPLLVVTRGPGTPSPTAPAPPTEWVHRSTQYLPQPTAGGGFQATPTANAFERPAGWSIEGGSITITNELE